MSRERIREVWKRWYKEGIIESDQDVLQMKYEVAAALEVCESIPGFDLAANALRHELHSFISIAGSREIEDYSYPDKEKILSGIKVPKAKTRRNKNE